MKANMAVKITNICCDVGYIGTENSLLFPKNDNVPIVWRKEFEEKMQYDGN